MAYDKQPAYAPGFQEEQLQTAPAQGAQPPPYSPPQAQPGYPPQQPGYPPQQPGYPPQQSGYPPQQAGIPAQPGYQQQPGYPPPQAAATHTTTIVQQPTVTATRTVLVHEKPPINHCLHCVISLIFWPWLIVWLCICLTH